MRFALVILAACSHAAAPVFPEDNRWRGVPIHVWHTIDLDNDGCKWHCTDIDVSEEPQ